MSRSKRYRGVGTVFVVIAPDRTGTDDRRAVTRWVTGAVLASDARNVPLLPSAKPVTS